MNSYQSFLLNVEADEILLKLLPEGWEQYFGRTDASQRKTVLRLEADESLREKTLSKGWSFYTLNTLRQAYFTPVKRPYFSLEYEWPTDGVTIRVREAFDSFVRSGVMYGMLTALHDSCVGLHGVTLICKNQAVVLSAPSGTGKTTLANLLEEYCDAKVINGDFALLSVSEGGVFFEPTPFCGTSRVCLNERLQVDRIVFLAQSKQNVWKEPEGRQAILSVMNNAFVPSFDKQLQQDVQNSILKLMSFVKISNFAFAPTEEATKVFIDMIAS